MVKFDLKTIPVISIGLYLRKRCISFCPDRHILICFIVNDNSTGIVLLVLAVFNKLIPIIHYNIYRMYQRIIK